MTSTDSRPDVAWLVGGHPFDRPSLEAMLDALDANVDLIEWPDAGRYFTREGAENLVDSYDVLALYDMPGIRLRRGASPEFPPPPPGLVEAWRHITSSGLPLLVLHHAIASWPAWEGFAEIVKGRFHYAPATLRGLDYPDSGYAMNVRQRFTVVNTNHPVCAGLPSTFELTDETYQCPIFEDEVEVLVRTDAPRDDAHHASSFAAVRRESNPAWRHAPASSAVAWTHRAGNSQLVYLQPGEGPEAFDNPNYRTLIGNAVAWLSNTRPNPDRSDGAAA
ncbi:MAG: ThuA domain-containing protein [Acidobacteria bacterium]|nr:ThuA domain-containing protein [Acidobacteriota bacterium]